MKYNYFCLLLFLFLSPVADAQDSLHMTRLGQWAPAGMLAYNDIWGYTAGDGSEYALIGNRDSVLVVDVSDCSNPVRSFGYAGGTTTIWRDIKTYGDYMYSVCDNCSEGLHIFDMSGLPGSPVSHVLTTTDFFESAHNIYIDEASAKLYATGTDVAVEGLVILDLSTPDAPTLIDIIYLDQEAGEPSENYYVHDVYVKNDTAYASHGYKGYYVWDLSDLNNVALLGSYDSPGYNHSSWTDGSGVYGYFAEEVPAGRPIAVMDLTNLGDPVNDIQQVYTFKDPLSTTSSNVRPHNPFVHNDTLYISYYEDGIKAYDLTDPAQPQLIGYYDTYPDNGNSYGGYNGAWGTYPFFDSGCLLVSDTKYGLQTLKMDCASPMTFYRDADGDGYGTAMDSLTGCVMPSGYVLDNTDCDDMDDHVYPGAVEVCDGKDNNCDGIVDEGCNLPPCDGDSLQVSVITQDSFFAKQFLSSTAIIDTGSDILFSAGNGLLLEAEFEVSSGASFEALIQDCDDTH